MKRRQATAVIAAWGVLNVALSTLMFAFTTDLMSHAVYWLANVFAFVMAGIALLSREREPGRRRIPEASAGAVALAAGVAFLCVGAAIGVWVAFIGTGLLVLAVILLTLELRP